MKNKWLVIAVVVLLLLGLGAFGYYKFALKSKVPERAEEHGGVFNSIQDALMKSLSLSCNYSQDSKTQVMAYIKNGKVRSIVTVKDDAAASGNALILPSEKKIYYWNGKTGYMMTLPDATVTPSAGSSAAQEEGKGNSIQDMWQSMEKFKQYCKTATVDDSLFVLPGDVVFQDVSKMMPSGVPSNVPSGMMPTGVNSQDIQKMMQQYAPTGY